MNQIEKILNKFYYLTILIILFSITSLIWPYISSTLVILTFAFLLTTILLPLVDRLERKIKSRVLSSIFVLLSIVLILIVFLTGFASGMLQQTTEFYSRLTQENFANQLNDIYLRAISFIPGVSLTGGFENPELAQKIQNLFTELMQQFIKIAKGGLNFMFFTGMVFVFTLILLIEYHNFRRTLVSIIPNKYFEVGLRIIHNTELQMSKYLTGQLLAATSVGILSFIGLLILNANGANITLIFFISIISGLSNLIPMVGPLVGMIPALLISIMNNLGNNIAVTHYLFGVIPSPFYFFDIILMFIIVQQIDNNFTTPILVGDSVGLHPIIVMISLFVGGVILGPLGMLFAVPTAGIIKVISREVIFLVRFAHLL